MPKQISVNQVNIWVSSKYYLFDFAYCILVAKSPPSAYSITILSFILDVVYTSLNLIILGWFNAYNILAYLLTFSCSLASRSAMLICLITKNSSVLIYLTKYALPNEPVPNNLTRWYISCSFSILLSSSWESIICLHDYNLCSLFELLFDFVLFIK